MDLDWSNVFVGTGCATQFIAVLVISQKIGRNLAASVRAAGRLDRSSAGLLTTLYCSTPACTLKDQQPVSFRGPCNTREPE
ncbi:hypothetical protein NDU88_007156 [Pleurodeles waltl]|uniref:Uncharacterized protein n=1 Tax=Pleurodeles waltl TaxID=8319 RepID=A0AAV7NWK3_PLEWA|nr:hypothetical protein NDU88_007156 [Pleurodeles waltl]